MGQLSWDADGDAQPTPSLLSLGLSHNETISLSQVPRRDVLEVLLYSAFSHSFLFSV